MAEIREIALSAALGVWSMERDPDSPQPANLRRILYVADRFAEWLDRPTPHPGLLLMLSEPRPIPER